MRIPRIGAVGEAGFQTTASLSATGTPDLDLMPYDRAPVATDTLDDVLCDCRRIDLIKCDVEGYEETVLRGAAKTIEAISPIIVLEILREQWPHGQVTASPAYRLLVDRGYIAYQFSQGRLHPESQFVGQIEDFIFVPPSRAPLVATLLQ